MLADNYNPVRQLGNGNTTSFSFGFDMISADYVEVYQEVGVVQSLVEPAEYTVNLSGSVGGTIVFNTAPAAGTYVVIARKVPLTQETPYKTSSGFSAVRTEQDFDKLTAITQQLNDEVERSVRMQVGTSDINLTLPPASSGKALVWNQDANALTNSTINVDSVIDEVTRLKDAAASSAAAAANSETNAGKSAAAADLSAENAASSATAAAKTAEDFDEHVTEKTTAFDEHVAAQTTVFDENAAAQTVIFNSNAKEKQTAVDNSAAAAANSAEKAESWATGTIETRPEGSAEYWAGVAKGQTLPEQSGSAGKWLGTDGIVASWKDVAKPVSVLPVSPEAGVLYCIPEV